MKKVLKAAALFLAVSVMGATLAGCSSTPSSSQGGTTGQNKKLVVGFAPGPYSDMFKKAIQPALEQKGYTFEYKEFSDYVQPNLALNNKELDANLFQHKAYLEKFSADKGLKLSPVINVPTAGLGIYSHKLQATNGDELKAAIKPGDEITLANDPTNLARALRLLDKNGLITIKEGIDATKASEKDIDKNPYSLKVVPMEAAQLPRTLDSVTLSVINGNYAISAGIPLSSAIIKEELIEDHKNLVAVRTEDLDKPFVKDLKEVVESEAFKNAIEDPKNVFKDFQKPQWYKDKWNVK
ncbi:MetQ/NlpA family ABC transporter substrate-binding protein [Heliophilum fasciatum]|uniref:D-methionine transport system substrate-binding protein n=1 Tax=Heliophilum fasciatum TaxID=35700 RepID=A0A4R2SC15_9FIRM|nr:MetQ/NlpA family ABC transporter substrate-binding protein [Heliophilum fasciatum]MCW2276824.1 D-methionine transport system substrate-binding protein [Heliophilum fasciatum]TCP68715.1 D-methionine transport system substrate-binding protein [Heliophilum fasciatum]